MSFGTNLWSAARRQAFELFGPTGLYVVVPDRTAAVTVFEADGTVHKAIGHNQRSWPVKVGTSKFKARRDSITSLYNHSPWVGFRVRIRLWLPNHADAVKLEIVTNELLARAAETAGYQKLLNGYVEAGPNFGIIQFEGYILEIAQRLRIMIWDEKGLNQFLNHAVELASLKGIQLVDRRGHKLMGHAPAFQRLCDRLIVDLQKNLT
jgi:hypothetical protein